MMRFILLVFFYITVVVNAHGRAPVVVPDTMAERVRACTICHSAENKATRDAYYPRIAGKPQGYLFSQLRNFRDGRRYYQPMMILLENMSDEYLLEIARYFSELRLPYPPPERIHMQPDEIRLAERLIYSGNPEQDIPACSACHGDNLMGIEPAIPGLLGLSRAYISAQLSGWRTGSIIRSQTSDCMSEIAKQLTDDEANAVAKWLANQPVAGESRPFKSLLPELVRRCSQNIQENGDSK
ncbi:c-type cytochrome [Nitrosomonas supralitoralis]|uniref:Cytochrome C n=1 Tax=Nitrosomonas supralitoralis TaxID=2116706 RepID=A0A2P7NVZ0_9PROT|nr:c-type cytochrome [Nitrosomonas supralitoralis]PSJ17636.1 cytochrome C [Nitrosomonas supralitoralis]